MTGRAVTPPLVLASGSPRRRELLERLGLAFEVMPPPDGLESPWDGTVPPLDFAADLARRKTSAVAANRPDAIVLGADTIVVLDGAVLGKPRDEHDARAMLFRLAGREHLVHTAVAIDAPGGQEHRAASGIETTSVRFRPLEVDEIAAYVATGEPLDKAGAYGIQGYGAALVESVRGCFFNVMGLPVTRVLALLAGLGWRYEFPGRLAPR
ncbi:MAG TPA: Maf family protein [Gemmatimonadota bacterium]|nr:Maf family protein [Gemmatimonadota bacterium]